MRIYCWWFGCKPHPQDPAPPEHITCFRCSELVPYSDLVGDTRHQRFIDGAKSLWYRLTKWWPRYCLICKSRRCDNDIDTHLPF